MRFYSQAGQDHFVYNVAVKGEKQSIGTFLDVGCADPEVFSNTYALEKIGWRGLLIDAAPHLAPLVEAKRASPFLCADATTIDWGAAIARHELPNVIDYLSFDVDGAGEAAFSRMPWGTLHFRILTVEHDSYRFGDGPKNTMRAILRDFGYDLLCPDVCNDGVAFEDWWVHPKRVNMTVANMFRKKRSTPWKEIVEAVEL